MGKDQRLHFRLDSAARDRLQAACDVTGLDEATVLRAVILAFVEQVESHGQITLPLAIIPKKIPLRSHPDSPREQAAALLNEEGAQTPGIRAPREPVYVPSSSKKPPARSSRGHQKEKPKPMPRTRAAIKAMVAREKVDPPPESHGA